MTTTSPGGGPDTLDERVTVKSVEYRKRQLDELDQLHAQISIVLGPYQFVAQGRV